MCYDAYDTGTTELREDVGRSTYPCIGVEVRVYRRFLIGDNIEPRPVIDFAAFNLYTSVREILFVSFFRSGPQIPRSHSKLRQDIEH